jgi:spermidine synthase
MLLVGLGGGSVAKSYAREGWKVDAVEIDPVVTRIAREHFGLEPHDAVVHDADGRRYLSTRAASYDLIILDAFGSSSIPFHLVTREAFDLVSRRLSHNGVLAINVQSIGWDALIVRSLAASLSPSFDEILALPMAEPPNTLGNVVLLAANRSLALVNEPEMPLDRLTAEYDRFHAWENRFAPDTRGVSVLTDDLNPSDLWAEAINLATRKRLHEFFGEKGVSW